VIVHELFSNILLWRFVWIYIKSTGTLFVYLRIEDDLFSSEIPWFRIENSVVSKDDSLYPREV
jgi:hypothetical protein